MIRHLALSLLVIAILASDGWAGLFHHRREGTPPPGRPRCRPHTDERAGHPRCIGNCAEPTWDPTGRGYSVGGGAALRSNGVRGPEDGTWGWDETGSIHLQRGVSLGWSHGAPFADRPGTYATDRPHGPLRRLLPMARELGN
jgi:hypothetical protein